MDVKSIVLKFPSEQTLSLRINNEKQGSTAGEILSSHFILIRLTTTFRFLREATIKKNYFYVSLLAYFITFSINKH